MKFYRYYADVPDKARAVAVSIDYQTWHGNPAGWSGWVESDDTSEALQAASKHVAGFKRCMSVQGGSASLPRVGGRYV